MTIKNKMFFDIGRCNGQLLIKMENSEKVIIIKNVLMCDSK